MAVHPDELGVSATSTIREINGIDLHVVTAGDPTDPTVVLLHGFPECWYGWHNQIAPLVEAGYHVVVPDQRGYNASEKPTGVSAYRLSALVADVASLITSQSDSAAVVGHDWGGVVAWALAIERPELVDRLAILNAPHPDAFTKTLATTPAQLRRSWYMLFFQLPVLPEFVWERTDPSPLQRALEDGARPGAFSKADIERYRQAWNQPGAKTAMLNWYRALVRYPPLQSGGPVVALTLVLWGQRDSALVPELGPRSLGYCVDGRLERVPEATHWLHHEFPDRVSALLVDHLQR